MSVAPSSERPIPLDHHILREPNAPSLRMDIFLPHDLWGIPPPTLDTDGEFTDILLCQGKLFQRKVAALTTVLRMALMFNRAEEGGYPRLGSDLRCDEFALACFTGNLHLDKLFWRRGGVKTYSQAEHTPISDADLEHAINPGQIVHTYEAGPNGERTDYHYMVCASEQSDQPQIFFSKPGSEPVGAHTIQSALRMYPATHIGIVKSMGVLPYDETP